MYNLSAIDTVNWSSIVKMKIAARLLNLLAHDLRHEKSAVY